MKYCDLLSKSVVGAKTSAPTVDEMKQEIRSAVNEACDKLKESTAIIPPMIDKKELGELLNDAIARNIPVIPENPPIDATLNDTIQQMLLTMKEMSEKDNSAPKNFDDYELNDDQISFVLSLLLKYQDKYFKDIPLAETLNQNFMWNIPFEVYDAAVAAETYGYPDQLNPIFWLYIMCTEVPHDMIGLFVLRAYTSMSDEDLDCIDKHANEYIKQYLTSDDSDDIEATPIEAESGVSSIESFDPDVDVESID